MYITLLTIKCYISFLIFIIHNFYIFFVLKNIKVIMNLFTFLLV